MAPELKVLIAFCIKNHVMCELTFAQKADGSNSFEHIWEMLVRSFPGCVTRKLRQKRLVLSGESFGPC